MSDRPFDFEGVFDDDYLYFYRPRLEPERSDREVDLIVRLLALPDGAEILDVPCGHGRIANRLAARGFRVTGVDASARYLEIARAEAPNANVTYEQRDIRALGYDGRFDAVVNWFTSLGYFDDATDRAICASFRRALKPGGKLVVEHMARDRMVASLPPPGWPTRVHLEEEGDDLLLDKVEFDPVAGVTRTERIVVRDGKVRRTWFTCRVFTPSEITSWLLDAGFARVDVYGAEGEPFTRASTRMILVAI